MLRSGETYFDPQILHYDRNTRWIVFFVILETETKRKHIRKCDWVEGKNTDVDVKPAQYTACSWKHLNCQN